MNAVLPVRFTESHRNGMALLREHGIAAVPSAVCHGVALRNLQRCGLVERIEIPGYWAITDAGRQMVLPEPVATTRQASHVPLEPVGDDRRKLEAAFSTIDSIHPGDFLFGQPVRGSALDSLFGKSRTQKFVYFAYPLGFPLKHIAWACHQDKPNWTDHNISVVRGQVLRLPSMRRVTASKEFISAEDAELRRALSEEEGLEEWEIAEYFAIQKSRVAL